MRYHGLSTRCSLSSRLLSSIFSFIAQTTEIIKDQNAPRHKHTHTHEASFVVSFVITAIESNVLSFRVPLLCIQRVCSCAHLCGFSILFLWPKERVHCACVCVCLFVCRFLFFYSWFGLVCFGFCYWCNHKNRTACVRTRTHTHTRTYVSEWFAAPISVAAHRSIFMPGKCNAFWKILWCD